jgi:hypothetical protein
MISQHGMLPWLSVLCGACLYVECSTCNHVVLVFVSGISRGSETHQQTSSATSQ